MRMKHDIGKCHANESSSNRLNGYKFRSYGIGDLSE